MEWDKQDTEKEAMEGWKREGRGGESREHGEGCVREGRGGKTEMQAEVQLVWAKQL